MGDWINSTGNTIRSIDLTDQTSVEKMIEQDELVYLFKLIIEESKHK